MAAGGPAQTSVYLFDVSNLTSPTLLHNLTQPGTVRFGTALSMFSLPAPDVGALLIVADTMVNNQQGALYIHHLNSTDPKQIVSVRLVQTLAPAPGDARALQFGYPVIASGSLFATSAQGASTVYVFACRSSGCTQLGNSMLDPERSAASPPPPPTYFGYMLALEMDVETDAVTGSSGSAAGTLIAGSFGASDGAGRAYVYRYSGGAWSLSQTLSPLASDQIAGGMTAFGSGVALRAGTAVVAAAQGNGGLGSLYVYYCHQGLCGELQQHIRCQDATACQQSAFGDNALALSATATFLAVGGRFGYGGYRYVTTGQTQTIEYLGTGAVWIFSTAPTFSPTARPTNPTASPTHSNAHRPTSTPSARATPGTTSRPTAIPTAIPTQRLKSPTSKPTASTNTVSPSPSSSPSSSSSPSPRPTSPTPAPSGALLTPEHASSEGASSQGSSTVSGPGEIAGVTLALLFLVALALALCWHFRKRGLWSEDGESGPDRRPTADTRSPYDLWNEYHDAKREGRIEDYVPPAEVANPTPPQVAIPGFVDPARRQSALMTTLRRLSTHMGLTTNLLAADGAGQGAELRPVGGAASTSGSASTDDARFDERGSGVRIDALYGRPSELPAPAAPSALRQLDRLEDGAAAELGVNPAADAGAPAAAAAAPVSTTGAAKRASVEYNPMFFKG